MISDEDFYGGRTGPLEKFYFFIYFLLFFFFINFFFSNFFFFKFFFFLNYNTFWKTACGGLYIYDPTEEITKTTLTSDLSIVNDRINIQTS